MSDTRIEDKFIIESLLVSEESKAKYGKLPLVALYPEIRDLSPSAGKINVAALEGLLQSAMNHIEDRGRNFMLLVKNGDGSFYSNVDMTDHDYMKLRPLSYMGYKPTSLYFKISYDFKYIETVVKSEIPEEREMTKIENVFMVGCIESLYGALIHLTTPDGGSLDLPNYTNKDVFKNNYGLESNQPVPTLRNLIEKG